mgnify:CR=1 FL=1
MSKLNWRNAHLEPKRKTSVVDEAEYRDRDAAARWLARNERKKPTKKQRLTTRAA